MKVALWRPSCDGVRPECRTDAGRCAAGDSGHARRRRPACRPPAATVSRPTRIPHREPDGRRSTCCRLPRTSLRWELAPVSSPSGSEVSSTPTLTKPRTISVAPRPCQRACIVLHRAEASRIRPVMVITTSEFGRQIAENGSAGTDHAWVACSSSSARRRRRHRARRLRPRCARRWRRAARGRHPLGVPVGSVVGWAGWCRWVLRKIRGAGLLTA